MTFELWGVTGTFDLILPDSAPGYLLFLLYSSLVGVFVYRFREAYRRLMPQQWAVVAGLSLLSLLASQLLPTRVFQNGLTTFTPFSMIPLLLAGAIFEPAVAVMVGLFAGLGQAFGETHALYSLFHGAFVAGLAAGFMRQSYRGQPYEWLRHPLVSSSLASSSLIVLTFLATFANVVATDGAVTALDRALFASATGIWRFLIEGLLAGGIVIVVLRKLPHLRPETVLALSPWQRSLRKRLLSQFVLFAVLLTVSLTVIVFGLSMDVSTKLVVNQMAHNARTVAAGIPDFQSHLQNLLVLVGDTESLLDGDVAENEKALKQLHRTDSFYRRILLVNRDQSVTASYPSDEVEPLSLTRLEQEAVSKALLTSTPNVATVESKREDHTISFVVPILDDEGSAAAALIGHVPQPSLENLIVGLQGTVGQGTGFIVDEQSRIIAHADDTQLLEPWNPPASNINPVNTKQTGPGFAYRTQQKPEEGRELVYYMEAVDHPWMVVTTVPHAVVLDLAMSIGGPLTLVLVAAMTIFYAKLASVGRDITRPITELVDAAKTITAGGKWSPPPDAQRGDEIGQLNQAFDQMHRSNNRRVRELSLLLDVSHNVASNIDINQGMPAILRGALRGTGAAGARAVVVNPNGSYPRTFGEGPASEAMARLDRPIMTNLRHSKELVLATPTQIGSALDVDPTDLPIPALVAIPLHFRELFRGVLWLGYRQSHGFDPAERTLLQTLAGQVAILVENARLYAVAEGGRRRLAAVLASTTDAVVVSDQTERILLVNRAMEQAFDLKANEVIGRPIADVIKIDELSHALIGNDERIRNLEIANGSGKIFFCSAAPIINNDGQAIGRVAVLHDITALREIDHLKSEFVAAVSHDLLSPLTFMRGYASMLPMVGDVNEEQEDYIEKILKGIDQVKTLVDELLDLGRIEAGVPLGADEIDIKLLLSDIAAEYRQHARTHGIKLRLEVEPGMPFLQGDMTLIRRAITNLVMNGIKYAPHSGPMILKAESLSAEVIISVQDHGPGVPKRDQMRLFEKFYRGRQRGDAFVKGAGLGLAIVRSIAERHGGRAWCESESGQGSTFSVSLPVQPTQDEDLEA
jgi:PAS domain S-box-containing protein